jgi:hypothetical protein
MVENMGIQTFSPSNKLLDYFQLPPLGHKNVFPWFEPSRNYSD